MFLIRLSALVGCVAWLLLRRRRPTKRELYFMAIWLASPLAIMKLMGGGVLLLSVHAPFALFHTWRARKRTTKELLRASWKVPLIFAGWALACSTAVLAQIPLSGGEMPDLDTFFNGYALGVIWIIVGSCFAAMALPLVIAWLSLVSFARRWPDGDRVVVEPGGDER